MADVTMDFHLPNTDKMRQQILEQEDAIRKANPTLSEAQLRDRVQQLYSSSVSAFYESRRQSGARSSGQPLDPSVPRTFSLDTGMDSLDSSSSTLPLSLNMARSSTTHGFPSKPVSTGLPMTYALSSRFRSPDSNLGLSSPVDWQHLPASGSASDAYSLTPSSRRQSKPLPIIFDGPLLDTLSEGTARQSFSLPAAELTQSSSSHYSLNPPVNCSAVDRTPYSSSAFMSDFGLDGVNSPDTPTSCNLTTNSTVASDLSRETSITDSPSGFPFHTPMSRNQSDDSSFLFAPFAERSFSDNNLVSSDFGESPKLDFPPMSAQSELCNSSDANASIQFPSVLTHENASLSSRDQFASGQPCSGKTAKNTGLSPRRLVPKTATIKTDIMKDQSGNQSARPVTSCDGPSKIRLEKTTYQKEKPEKIKCTQCDKHPQGFRGPHELTRHISRCHSGKRVVWIAVDYEGDFLKGCKACDSGKRYGQYYGVAAHLRRTHFHPRERNRNKNAPKRGGLGGGKHPAMDILKSRWMRQLVEVVDENQAAPQDNSEEESPQPQVEESTGDSQSSRLDDEMELETPIFDTSPMQQYADVERYLLNIGEGVDPTRLSLGGQYAEHSPLEQTSFEDFSTVPFVGQESNIDSNFVNFNDDMQFDLA